MTTRLTCTCLAPVSPVCLDCRQPCLVSDADSPPLPGLGKANGNRRTLYTVEAISLEPLLAFGDGRTKRTDERWIGINQNRSNRFIEHFLRNGSLPELLPRPSEAPEVLREQIVGKSKIDFLVRVQPEGSKRNLTSYLEVKTPLIHLPTEGHPNAEKDDKKFTSFHRLVKHFGDLADTLPAQKKPTSSSKTTSKKRKKPSEDERLPEPAAKDRSILLLTFHYEAPEFRRPPPTSGIKAITEAADAAAKRGVEFYQVNLKMDREGVELVKCWKLPDDY